MRCGHRNGRREADREAGHHPGDREPHEPPRALQFGTQQRHLVGNRGFVGGEVREFVRFVAHVRQVEHLARNGKRFRALVRDDRRERGQLPGRLAVAVGRIHERQEGLHHFRGALEPVARVLRHHPRDDVRERFGHFRAQFV
jgi:hypothetical protein